MIIAGKYVIAYFLLSDGNNLFIIGKVSRGMKLAEIFMALRKQRGWSQEDLAQQLSVSRQSVSKWESGASVPDLDKILKMSEVFDVSTDALLIKEKQFPPTGRRQERSSFSLQPTLAVFSLCYSLLFYSFSFLFSLEFTNFFYKPRVYL